MILKMFRYVVIKVHWIGIVVLTLNRDPTVLFFSIEQDPFKVTSALELANFLQIYFLILDRSIEFSVHQKYRIQNLDAPIRLANVGSFDVWHLICDMSIEVDCFVNSVIHVNDPSLFNVIEAGSQVILKLFSCYFVHVQLLWRKSVVFVVFQHQVELVFHGFAFIH